MDPVNDVGYCFRHQIHTYNCPECRRDEAANQDIVAGQEEIIDSLAEEGYRASEDRQDIIASLTKFSRARAKEAQELMKKLEEMEFKRVNPGDYTCPECLYVTLKRSGSRCPMCHANIPGAYWEKIFEKEKAAVEREALPKKVEDLRLQKAQLEIELAQAIELANAARNPTVKKIRYGKVSDLETRVADIATSLLKAEGRLAGIRSDSNIQEVAISADQITRALDQLNTVGVRLAAVAGAKELRKRVNALKKALESSPTLELLAEATAFCNEQEAGGNGEASTTANPLEVASAKLEGEIEVLSSEIATLRDQINTSDFGELIKARMRKALAEREGTLGQMQAQLKELRAKAR